MKKIFKKAQVVPYVIFSIFAIFMILIMTLMIPLGIRIGTEMYASGETIVRSANASLSRIQNDTVEQKIRTQLQASLGNIEGNIEVNNAFFQYSGYIWIGIIAFVMFLVSRQIFEVQGGGGFA